MFKKRQTNQRNNEFPSSGGYLTEQLANDLDTINPLKKPPKNLNYGKNVPQKVAQPKGNNAMLTVKMATKKMNPTEKAYHAWVESICKFNLFYDELNTGQTDIKSIRQSQELDFEIESNLFIDSPKKTHAQSFLQPAVNNLISESSKLQTDQPNSQIDRKLSVDVQNTQKRGGNLKYRGFEETGDIQNRTVSSLIGSRNESFQLRPNNISGSSSHLQKIANKYGYPKKSQPISLVSSQGSLKEQPTVAFKQRPPTVMKMSESHTRLKQKSVPILPSATQVPQQHSQYFVQTPTQFNQYQNEYQNNSTQYKAMGTQKLLRQQTDPGDYPENEELLIGVVTSIQNRNAQQANVAQSQQMTQFNQQNHEHIVDYFVTEERKFLLYKQWSAEGHFRRLANSLPYNPERGRLLPEILQNYIPERPLFFALQMHLYFIAACCVVESVSSTLELNKLTDVFNLCHRNLILLIETYNNSTIIGMSDHRLSLIVDREKPVKQRTNTHHPLQTVTLLRQNNEHNRLSLRKVAIAIKSLAGLQLLGNQILEAVRVGTSGNEQSSQDKKLQSNQLSEECLQEFKFQIQMLRQDVRAITFQKQGRPRSKSGSSNASNKSHNRNASRSRSIGKIQDVPVGEPTAKVNKRTSNHIVKRPQEVKTIDLGIDDAKDCTQQIQFYSDPKLRRINCQTPTQTEIRMSTTQKQNVNLPEQIAYMLVNNLTKSGNDRNNSIYSSKLQIPPATTDLVQIPNEIKNNFQNSLQQKLIEGQKSGIGSGTGNIQKIKKSSTKSPNEHLYKVTSVYNKSKTETKHKSAKKTSQVKSLKREESTDSLLEYEQLEKQLKESRIPVLSQQSSVVVSSDQSISKETGPYQLETVTSICEPIIDFIPKVDIPAQLELPSQVQESEQVQNQIRPYIKKSKKQSQSTSSQFEIDLQVEVDIQDMSPEEEIYLEDSDQSPISVKQEDEVSPTEAVANEPADEDQKLAWELALLRSQVKIPYLEPIPESMASIKLYTLVLDLDETLIHFQGATSDDPDEEGFYMIRPGCNKFLKELSQLYEIVVFTAAMPDYADWILDQIDEIGYISKRLYRQHCSPQDDYAIKDLRNLGRDLRRTIIVDNLAENFMQTPENGIWVESWYNDLEDEVLPTLQTFLSELVEKQVDDVRLYLTPECKKKILYKCLESGEPIPSITKFKSHLA